jgi:hypothetical protein
VNLFSKNDSDQTSALLASLLVSAEKNNILSLLRRSGGAYKNDDVLHSSVGDGGIHLVFDSTDPLIFRMLSIPVESVIEIVPFISRSYSGYEMVIEKDGKHALILVTEISDFWKHSHPRYAKSKTTLSTLDTGTNTEDVVLDKEGYYGIRLGHSHYEVVVRKKGKVYPLPHVEKYSPEGYSWQWGTPGCVDMAISLLKDAIGIDVEIPSEVYQKFKRDIVFGWKARWFMSLDDVIAWSKKHNLF